MFTLVLIFPKLSYNIKEDTPYMKLIDSHKGIDKMIVCLPMIQKTADNYKKAIQISIKEDSIDVQEYLNKKDNPPYKFKSFHGLMKGYHEAVLFRMVGEWWIAVRTPEDEEAKKKYQKNHIVNKAISLSHGISYTLYEPYLKKCGDGFNQLAKENDLIKKYIELLNKKVEEEIYESIVKAKIVENKEEQPKYFICENKNKDPLYIKFHITDKKWFDYDTLKDERVDLPLIFSSKNTLPKREEISNSLPLTYKGSKSAFFLDRDGIINVDKSYVYKKEDVEFMPGVVDFIQYLQSAFDYCNKRYQL